MSHRSSETGVFWASASHMCTSGQAQAPFPSNWTFPDELVHGPVSAQGSLGRRGYPRAPSSVQVSRTL